MLTSFSYCLRIIFYIMITKLFHITCISELFIVLGSKSTTKSWPLNKISISNWLFLFFFFLQCGCKFYSLYCITASLFKASVCMTLHLPAVVFMFHVGLGNRFLFHQVNHPFFWLLRVMWLIMWWSCNSWSCHKSWSQPEQYSSMKAVQLKVLHGKVACLSCPHI